MAHDIVSPKKSLRFGLFLGAAMLSACTTSSHVLLGQTRTPLSSSEVRLYLEPVSGPHEKIAVVDASSGLSFAWTAQAKSEVVVQRLKLEAAKLGANAIVLEEISEGGAGSVGAGVAPDLTRDHASLGVGFNAAGLMALRYGRGVAIFIAPGETGLPAR